MPKPATGELRPLANGWEARIRIDEKTRKGFELAFPASEEKAARERCTAMATIAMRLRHAGHSSETEKLLEMAARARGGKPMEAILAAVNMLCAGQTTPNAAAPMTVKELGDDWRSGKLHQKHRDHVKLKKESSVRRDDSIAKTYIDPLLQDVPVADVTLEDCEAVMASIPDEREAGTRRQVAQYLRRLLQMAVYPLRLRETNPIPKGWLPRVPNTKAKECLYPDEDASLLRCPEVPLLRRIMYGFLDREGMRSASEAAALTYSDLDLQRGRIALDENKSDEPRDWDLDPGVWRALKIWKERFHPKAKPTDRVFSEESVPINTARLAEQLRRDLKAAGITREKLFEKSAARMKVRAHDLRSTFITIALATGKTETWVADRTGHTSSAMINRYRRKARGWKLGPLTPLDEAIPELALPHECPWPDSGQSPASEPTGENAEGSTICLQATGTDGPFESAASAIPPLRLEPSIYQDPTLRARRSCGPTEDFVKGQAIRSGP